MTRSPLVLSIALAAAASTPAAAQFLPDGPSDGPSSSGFGVRAGVSTSESCPSFCTGDFSFDSDGGEFALTASAADSTYGVARSSGSFDASSTYLPTLRAYASANARSGASASATGVQAFRYDGDAPREIVVEYQLDAVLTGSPSADADDLRAVARVGAYRGTDVPFFTDFGTLFFEILRPDQDLGRSSLAALEGGSFAEAAELSFTVNPGENFYVIGQLSANAERGGLTDAENTFTSSFVDATGITPVGVPEPTTAAALGLAGGLALLRRQRA